MSTRSIYLTNGKPLSQQALYQQKLKQGVYNQPGLPSVGVNSNASDTAALLAASADLTVKPSYERVVAVEAHDAAQAARNGRTSTFSSLLAAAAASVLGVQGGTGIPDYSRLGVYKKATLNSTLSLTLRTDPEHRDYRHGLVTKLSLPAFNIGKILSVANQNSTRTLDLRFNPELDYRSGLPDKVAPPTEYLDAEEEKLAAQSAVASLKYGGLTSDAALQSLRNKTSFSANDVVNRTLLDAANKAAQLRLASLQPGAGHELDFKTQAHLYAGALALAQKRSDERVASHKAGVIDLGGGLTILQSELDKMALLIVQPVLNDIKLKAELQREQDEIARLKQQERVAEHERFKKEEVARKLHERADLDQAKKERILANETRKAEEDAAFATHQTAREEEVATKQLEKQALEEKYNSEKEALLAEKQAEIDRIEEEETGLINGRKEELKAMQDEKDELLKPTLDELAEETSKLKELTDARDELLNEVKASETTNAEYHAKVKELEEKLAATKAETEEFTQKLEDATKKHEETTTTVDELQAKSQKDLAEAEETHRDLDTKIAELEKTKGEHLDNKSKTKAEILAGIDAKVAHEHKVNAELPEHLRTTVDEKKLRDTLSLFSHEPKPEPEARVVEAEKPAVAVEKPQSSNAKAVAAAAAVSNKPKPSPAAATSVKEGKEKKPSPLKRFAKKYFSTPEPRDPSKTFTKEAADTKAPVSKTTPAAASAAPAASEPAQTGLAAPKKAASESKDEVETLGDDSSLNKSTQPGGLFKEEI